MCVLLLAGGVVLWRFVDAQVERRSIDAIEDAGTEAGAAGTGPVEFLVVGSDDRSGLTEEQRVELSTGGEVGPVRTDVVLVVQLRPGAQTASMLSLPRDLLVERRGAPVKLNSVLARAGRDGLVRTVEDLVGIELDHYVETSIPAFLTVVEAVGGVEVCLDEPLVDEDAGADLPAGCQELDAAEALAFVRSREGDRGDFRRIERQQRFLRALIDEVTSARTAVDVPRLFRTANRLAGSLTTDEDLSLGDLRALADELRGLAAGDVAAATVPAYSTDRGLALYAPGAGVLFEALQDGENLPDTGTRERRAEARIELWAASPERAQRIESVLFFLGFEPQPTDGAPIDPIGLEVFAGPGGEEVAGWVANVLGTEVRDLPADTDAGRIDALVAVGGR